MKRIAVLSVDQTKAQFFILRAAERPAEQWSPVLEPRAEIINRHWYAQHSETLTGGTRFSYHVGLSGMAQTMHGYDDHLGRHQREIEKRFSRELFTQIHKFVSRHSAQTLLIAADSKMLGEIRQQLATGQKLKIEVTEICANLGKLSPVELHEHLSGLGLLPRRSPPADPQNKSHSRAGQWRRRAAPNRTGENASETEDAG
jgi:protein required for attachment to host cells